MSNEGAVAHLIISAIRELVKSIRSSAFSLRSDNRNQSMVRFSLSSILLL